MKSRICCCSRSLAAMRSPPARPLGTRRRLRAQRRAVETLTMEQAIEIAMQQQPSLRQSRAPASRRANGRVDQASVTAARR